MFRTRTTGAALVLTLATALLAGCGGMNSAGPDTGSGNPAAQASPVAASEQLKFAAKTVDGQDFSGESLTGKPAVFWFWTPWCPTCQGEAPGLGAAARAHGDKVTFVGVAAQDEVPAMREFVGEYKVDSFRHLADVDGAIWKRFGVTRQPAYAFIHPDGKVEVVKDPLPEKDLTERVKKLAGA